MTERPDTNICGVYVGTRGPRLEDFDLDNPPTYFDRRGREWEIIGRTDQPTLLIQRVGIAGVIHPLEHLRQSIIPCSPWARENWRTRL